MLLSKQNFDEFWIYHWTSLIIPEQETSTLYGDLQRDILLRSALTIGLALSKPVALD